MYFGAIKIEWNQELDVEFVNVISHTTQFESEDSLVFLNVKFYKSRVKLIRNRLGV